MDGGNMERVLHLMADKGASDVYLTANSPIQLKINGQLVPVSDQILTPGQPRALLAELLTPVQLEELDQTGELNLGIGIRSVGSFRLSAFKQRASIAAVIRGSASSASTPTVCGAASATVNPGSSSAMPAAAPATSRAIGPTVSRP